MPATPRTAVAERVCVSTAISHDPLAVKENPMKDPACPTKPWAKLPELLAPRRALDFGALREILCHYLRGWKGQMGIDIGFLLETTGRAVGYIRPIDCGSRRSADVSSRAQIWVEPGC